ncbi:MAG: c-type cytochrome [Pyrinomonadaceae bacterium]
MSKNSGQQQAAVSSRLSFGKMTFYCAILAIYCLLAVGCRYDMQDQPRYKAYKKSDFFGDKKAMRQLPEGTVARGFLREDKAFYTGKKENAGAAASAPSAAPATDASGAVTSFPDVIEKIPVPVTQQLLDRGEQRYKVFCIVCHGPVGNGDGMVVRRGYPKPPTYNDDRLRNAPDGHFFDVMTNGWGKMNSYASQVPPADRWAIVAYIRALQISQNPNGNVQQMNSNTTGGAATNQTTQNNAAPQQNQNAGGQNR